MKTKLSNTKALLIALICLFSFNNVWGQTTITNEAGLRAIADNLSGDYVLANDITLTTEWEPIGSSDDPFTGSIDGGRNTIYGLIVNKLEDDGVGFIGTAENATVKNLNIVSAEVYGKNWSGIIIGTSYGTSVSSCATSGIVYGEDHVAGIIGSAKLHDSGAYTEVSNCFSNAAVVSRWHQAGGIIGAAADASVSKCYFSGVATSTVTRTGGIVGLTDGGSLLIEDCVALSAYLKSGDGDGGDANAILGADNSDAVSTIVNCYSYDGMKLYENGVEKVRENNDATSYDGAYKTLAELQTASFWTTTVGFSTSIWDTSTTYPVLNGLTTPLANSIYLSEIPERSIPSDEFTITPTCASTETISFSSSNTGVATIDATGLVKCIADGTTTITCSAVGDGYFGDVSVTCDVVVKGLSYTIMDEEDLRAMVYDLEGDFTLGAHISVTGDWEPLGEFTGTLDGQGYTISGLYYDNSSNGNIGLFSTTKGATIQRVGIIGAYFVGNADVGAIVGYAYGTTISQCFVDQSSYIAGRDHVAAIAGNLEKNEIWEDGADEAIVVPTTITDCYAMAEIYSREWQAGGIGGAVRCGTIERCYFSGRVISENGTSGGIYSIIDDDSECIIRNNVSLACGVYNTLSASYCIGGSPRTGTTTLENNYVDYYATYKGTSLANAGPIDSNDANSENGMTLYKDEVLSSTWYESTPGWDFDNVWTFPTGGEGNTYPILNCQKNKEVTPRVYGLENRLYMLQTSDGPAVADLSFEKIKTTSGQKLTFDIIDGEDYVFLYEDGATYLGFAAFLEDQYTAILSLAPEAGEIAGVDAISPTQIEVLLIGVSAELPISTVADFLAIDDLLFTNYRLENDIDMEDVYFEGLGSSSNPFTGTFDGNGYTIFNVSLTTNTNNSRGIFNNTSGATIKNLGIVNFSRADASSGGSSQMGTLVGTAVNTTIDQCYMTGTVSGDDHVGGLTGQCNNVTVKNTFVDVAVSSSGQIGGFTGTTTGNITFENCYFNGSVSTPSVSWEWCWGGGFIGLVDVSGITQTFTGCVAIGDVSAPHAGWFIGGNGTDQSSPNAIINMSGCAYNYDASIDLWSDSGLDSWDSAGYPTADGGSVSNPVEYYMIPTNEFLTQAPYNAASFDFTNIWTMDASVNGGYPTLTNVPFKTEYVEPVGIAQATDQIYKVGAMDNTIVVAGMSQSTQVSVYTTTGQLVSTVTASDCANVKVAAKGIYIVRIVENGAATVAKVVVK